MTWYWPRRWRAGGANAGSRLRCGRSGSNQACAVGLGWTTQELRQQCTTPEAVREQALARLCSGRSVEAGTHRRGAK
jgi:hypothetical protein